MSYGDLKFGAYRTMPGAIERRMAEYLSRQVGNVTVDNGKLIFPKLAQAKIVLFNAPYPINSVSVGQLLVDLLGGEAVDQEAIRATALDDESRTKIWNSLLPATQKELQKHGNVAQYLTSRYGSAQQEDEKIRREIRMALLAIPGLAQLVEGYLISWGSGTNLLFPEAIRFYFEFNHEQLAGIYSTSYQDIHEANAAKEKWYQHFFKMSRADHAKYTHTIYSIPEWVKTPADLEKYVARSIATSVQLWVGDN